MAENNPLPELPLMLAGVARPVAELLYEIGIPAAPLPREALATRGAGRFVLYDSRRSSSTARARRAKKQGLDLIDVAPFSEPAPSKFFPFRKSTVAVSPAATRSAARVLLEKLKLEVEARGGVWLRVGDYPFPYQSAFCLAIEHSPEERGQFLDHVAAFAGRATHFVSPKIPAAELRELPVLGTTEWGWSVGGETPVSPRRLLARCQDAALRFREAGLAVGGLAQTNDTTLPSLSSLTELGLRFSCEPFAGVSCGSEITGREQGAATWVRFGTVDLGAVDLDAQRNSAHATDSTPLALRSLWGQSQSRVDSAHVLGDSATGHENAASWLEESLSEHYRSGQPLFLRQSTSRLGFALELRGLIAHAARCSLLWHASFADFALWWSVRRQIQLQVWRRENGFEVHAAGMSPLFPASIEVWRGKHLATLPLKEPVLHMADGGLVFLKGQSRSPAGFTIIPPATDLTASSVRSVSARSESVV